MGLLLHSTTMSSLIPAEGRSENFSGWASCLHTLGVRQQSAAAQILLAETRLLMGSCDAPHPGGCTAPAWERLQEHRGFPSHQREWKQQSLLSLWDVPRSPALHPGPRAAEPSRDMLEKVGRHLAPFPG